MDVIKAEGDCGIADLLHGDGLADKLIDKSRVGTSKNPRKRDWNQTKRASIFDVLSLRRTCFAQRLERINSLFWVDVTATVRRLLARQPIHAVMLAEIGFRQIAVLRVGALFSELIYIVVYAMEVPIADLFSFDVDLREYGLFDWNAFIDSVTKQSQRWGILMPRLESTVKTT